MMRETVTQETWDIWVRAVSGFDVAPLLGQVRSPTLVLHHRRANVLGIDVAANLASKIPDARLVLVEGSKLPDSVDAQVAAIDDFLGYAGQVGAEFPSSTAAQTDLTVILFADIAGSTGLTERLGDRTFREKARGLDTSLRALIREHEGTAIEGRLLGDGVLAVFTSARQAIEAALRCAGAGDAAGLALHLGLHAGDVIREEGNIYGGAVNVAARIADVSAPGEVLVSQTVRDLARTSARGVFEERGECALKGVSEPVRVWAVRTGASP